MKPRDNGYFQFKVGVPSGSYKIKIVHHSGYFTCSPLGHQSNFGCYLPGYFDNVWIMLTSDSDQILLPGIQGSTIEAGSHPRNTSFAIFNDVIQLSLGQKMRFWYKEDLDGNTGPESDNGGSAKFYAYALMQ